MDPAIVLVLLLLIGGQCAVGYYLGETQKARPKEGALLGLFLGVIGWVLILMMDDHRRTCQACRKVIHEKATICRFCHTPFREV